MNKAHTLFIERVLYFSISHSNEHRLHTLYLQQGIHFSVRFQPGEMQGLQAEDEEVLMPTTKCNSHKEAASGQLITRQPGLYTLMFDNTSSK